jgi:hypothetical protein
MSTSLKSVALVAATAFAVLGSVGAAEAGGKRHGIHKFHKFHHLNHRPHMRLVIGGHGCGYLYRRWMLTGSRYWKWQYLDCRGDLY